MIPDIGYTALLLALLAAIYSALAAWYGKYNNEARWIKSARNATIATLPLLLLSSGLLITSILRNDFSVEYVWRVSSIEMPTYLKYTALWGGQAGSLLFWNLVLAIFTAVAMASNWRDQKELIPYALIVSSLTQIFFLGISLFVENPFARLEMIPANGNGLNPLLRHPGMIIHPPMLYLGYIGFIIPYTFAMAALMAGKLDDGWIKATRRWTLTAWLFLSLGLVLGGRWAYDVLGWGGYWGWDPVENASLMPWLSGTAFLHSVMIQEKRKMFKWWNMVLIVLTYSLVVWGTFIVRSGVISSVHSFARSAIGPLFFGFVVIMLLFSAYWITKRRDQLATGNKLNSLLSREAAFLYNNFLIITILVIVFFFTHYPMISEIFTGEQGFVGPPVYKKALAPLFALLVLLMGVAPLTMWYRSSAKRLEMAMRWPTLAATVIVAVLFGLGIHSWGALIGLWATTLAAILTLLEFWKGTRARMKKGEPVWTAFARLLARNRRRYGGYWIHIGVLMMALGIIGIESFQQETQLRLETGDRLTLGHYEMELKGINQYPGPDDLIVTEATVDVYKNGKFVKTLLPRTELYTRTGQPMTIPSIRSTIADDFYVLLVNWEPTSATGATFRVYINPLVNWVWFGGLVFIIGTLIAVWSDRKRETAVSKSRPMALGTAD